MKIEKEHEFQREQIKLENQWWKKEREHEMRMLNMMLGNPNQLNHATTSTTPPFLNASIQHQNIGSVSSMHTSACCINEDKTYFQL